MFYSGRMSDVIAEEPHFIAERDGHILTVTLNRPAAKNAFSPTMLVGVADAWKTLNDDPELRVGILTGAGGDFCSGMDLKALAAGFSDEEMARMAEDPDLHWKALLRHGRPEQEIVQVAAERRAGLVVLGLDPGRRPGPGRLGHTARFVVDHAETGVLLLPMP